MPEVAAASQCQVCGRPVPERDRTRGGRRPRYCSGACKAKAYRDRQHGGQAPGPGAPALTAPARHARAVEIRHQISELAGILADTASGQQSLFPAAAARRRPPADTARALHDLIGELATLASAAAVTKRVTKRRPTAEAPQRPLLFDDADDSDR